MEFVNIKIEGYDYKVEKGLTILEAAKKCGYEIPTLCKFNAGGCSSASCRVCLVEVVGSPKLVTSCVYPVTEGMEIKISTARASNARRTSVELIMSNHNKNCTQCSKNGKCELLHVAQITGARENKFEGAHSESFYDEITPSIVRDTSKCVLCGRCVEVCKNTHGIGILAFEKRGFETVVGPAFNRSLAESPCLLCGQCVNVCPTGALMEKSELSIIDQAFLDKKYMVVQAAPAVRAALGEEFGMPIGTTVTGKMVAALKRLGFNKVFDVNFGADLTIMEEASELIYRVSNNGLLPMITSCSPGWVNYAEYFYPELVDHLSSCKSPHQMQGAITKTYFAEKMGIDPKDIFVVSIMPCVAKKQEKERPQNSVAGLKDVDAVLTTRELGTLIKRAGIQFTKLPNEEFDQDLLGEYSGAGVIFGVTGGVMEAACRTAYNMLTNKETDSLLEFTPVRGFEGVKEASLDIEGLVVNIAVAHGMKNAKVLLEQIKKGESKYHFIEIMGCPGGCINGGGQPFVRECFLPNEDDDIMQTYRQKRANVLYSEDVNQPIRRSHLNTQIQELYNNYLGKPNGHKAHKLLHTSYNKDRQRFPK